MARKKTKLAYIPNDAARRTTLRKRRLGLLKKARELSILCNVPACAIIYSPQETEPQAWPSKEEARAVLNRFDSAEGFSKSNNMMNQEKLLSKQLARMRGRLSRVSAENDELAGEVLLLGCLSGRLVSSGFESCELGLIGRAIERRIEAVEARLLRIGKDGCGGEGGQALPLMLVPDVVEEGDGLLGWEQGGIFGGFESFCQQPSF